MASVNIHEAKTHLSRYVEAVETGARSEVVIARNGRPVAKLVAFDAPSTRPPIRFGLAKGKFVMPADFDAHDGHIEKLFNGSADD